MNIFSQISLKFLTFFGAPCEGGTFLGFPTWYKYLDGTTTTIDNPLTGTQQETCNPVFANGSDIWLVAAAVIEILLRVAIILAVVFIVVGGVKYITSQGNPDSTASALRTIISACVGLVIAIVATALVSFLARSIAGV